MKTFKMILASSLIFAAIGTYANEQIPTAEQFTVTGKADLWETEAAVADMNHQAIIKCFPQMPLRITETVVRSAPRSFPSEHRATASFHCLPRG